MKFGDLPASMISVALSVALSVLLWRLDVVNPGPAIVAGLLLELVVVTHRMLLHVNGFGHQIGQISSLPDLRQIVSDIDQISRDNRRFTKLILLTMAHNFLLQTSQLRNGRLVMSPDQFMVLARAIYGNLGRSDTLMATSYFAGGDYWTTRYGGEYATLNRRASAQGAKIKRIYMLRDKLQLAEKNDILCEQTKFSEVHVLLLNQIPLADSDQRDFLVINDQLAAEFHFAGGQIVSTIDLILDGNAVIELNMLMQKLLSHSEPVTGAADVG